MESRIQKNGKRTRQQKNSLENGTKSRWKKNTIDPKSHFIFK